MAKTTKYFKNEQALATWLDGGMLPSGVLAVVLDETGDGVAQIQTSTNNIDGKYETYEVEKVEEKKYASNGNVYVNSGKDINLQWLMKENIYSEFDYPEKEGDIFVTPFEFYLVSINYPVDIENVKLYFGDINIMPSGTQWINIKENTQPIHYTLFDNGVYKCSVEFSNDVAYNQNFFRSYTLPTSSSTQIVDDYIIAYWKSGVS